MTTSHKLCKPCHERFDLEDAVKESGRCLLCKDAPCSEGCPAGTDPGKFIRQIRFENYLGAARTIRRNNPMGHTCSTICPVEKLCVKACSVKALEKPIDIRNLQEFACSFGKEHGLEPLTPTADKQSEKIAIIGAGSAGISCACALAMAGYEVVVFEREKKAGGVATWNIPQYRLPLDVVQHDLQNLIDLGVKIKYHSDIATPDAITKLRTEGFKAIFISTGLVEPYRLPLFSDCENVVDYIQFLRDAKSAKPGVNLKNKIVAVIGGGSVAVDAACSAVQLGARKVYLVALEDLEHLPADEEEIKLAQQMHVIIKPNTQVTAVKKNTHNKTKVVGLSGIEIEPEQPGKFIPGALKQLPGTEFNLCVDYVIEAIGTKPESMLASLVPGIKVQGKGTIAVRDNFATSVPGIFAGGDVVNGGTTIAQAVGEGKKAAQSIIDFIRGE